MALNLGIKSKVALAAGSLGVIGGGGTLAGHLLLGDTVEDNLKKIGFTILKEDDQAWTTVLVNYTAAKSNNKLKFGNFEGGTGKEIEKKLREHCKSLLSQKYKTAKTSEDYKKWVWCVKEQTAADYLKVEKRKVYKIEKTTPNDDNDLWDKKTKQYSNLSDDAKNKISSLNLGKTKIQQVAEEDRNKVKDACKTLIEKKHYEEDFEKSKSLATDWCSEPIKTSES